VPQPTQSEPKTRKGEKMMEEIKRFLKEEDGVTAIEYGLIAALIAVGIVLSVTAVRDWLVGVFNAVVAAGPAV